MEMQTIKEENMVIDDDIPPPGGGGGGGDGGAFLEEEEKALKIATSGGGSGGSLPASPTSVPNPKQGLFGGLPPFLRKTFEMVEDPETNEVISWSDSKKSFIVFDHNYFSANFLPKYFKHSNFSSFIKQLNIYGFKKIHSDTWEFENEGFQAGKKHLLKTIKRKKQNPQNLQQQETMRPLLHSPQSGVEAELQKLRNDWNEMKMEILKLKQQQESTESCLVAVKEKIENITKCRQQQIFVSMAKALANPAMPKLIKLLRQKRQLCNAQIAKKQRLAVPPSDKNSVEAMDDDSTTRQVADRRDTIESVLQTLLCNGQMAKKNWRFSGPQSDKNSVEAMDDDDDDSTTSQVGNGGDQNQAELATIESEVKTLFSASMGDEGSPSMDQKANVANPGSVSHDLSSENYILLEKLMNDEFDAQAEPELKQLHSKTVHEWESLIEATGGGNGSGFC